MLSVIIAVVLKDLGDDNISRLQDRPGIQGTSQSTWKKSEEYQMFFKLSFLVRHVFRLRGGHHYKA